MKWFLVVSALAAVNCRPQSSDHAAAQNINTPVEFEKQELLEIHPEGRQLTDTDKQKSIEEQTRQILDNIAEVNRKHGFTARKRKPEYFHFPYSYSRSQSGNDREEQFRFSNNPYTNPIFEYLSKIYNVEDSSDGIKVYIGNKDEHQGLKNEKTSDDDDVPPGHYIKRKIVHQQTVITPIMPNIPQFYQQPSIPPYLAPVPNVPPNYIMNYPSDFSDPEKTSGKPTNLNKTLSSLEKETVENIKNIVLNSQMAPVHLNPYMPPNVPYSYQYPYQMNPNSFIQPGSYNYQLYGPYIVPSRYGEARQQFQWPWAQFFPIVIRDPMVQMMNAITSMVEFGQRPGAAAGGCRHNLEDEKNNKENRTSKKLEYEIKNANTNPEVTIIGADESAQGNITALDIEDLIIKSDKSDPKKTFLGFKSWKTHSREAKISGDESTKINLFNVSKDVSHFSVKTAKSPDDSDQDQKRFPLFPRPLNQQQQQPNIQHATEGAVPWLPVRNDEQAVVVDEKEDEVFEEEKDVVSHDGNKKLFSKDNTGSGIFIHKLKVRKGGVAIAGPGGIATAGSGGTAIVGPNGLAYTHPDGLAIAGSGTKVVAVDPSINLSDLISGNNTRKGGNIPRVGKVVAIGPVVYYNKG